MRAVIQRVSKASVLINGSEKRSVGHGLLVLVGIEHEDGMEDVDWLSAKITRLRVFSDENNKMNWSLSEVGGQIMLISQFTLHASTRKGNRPSYVKAAAPDHAIPLYEALLSRLESDSGQPVISGEFGAHMEVELVNDGPVTIIIDTKNRE